MNANVRFLEVSDAGYKINVIANLSHLEVSEGWKKLVEDSCCYSRISPNYESEFTSPSLRGNVLIWINASEFLADVTPK